MLISENSVFTARFNVVMQPDERAKLQRLAEDAKARESTRTSPTAPGWAAKSASTSCAVSRCACASPRSAPSALKPWNAK